MFLFLIIYIIIYLLLMKINYHKDNSLTTSIGNALFTAFISSLVSIFIFTVAVKIIYSYAPKAPAEYVFYQKMEPMANVEFASDTDRFYMFNMDGSIIYQTNNQKHYFNTLNKDMINDDNTPQWNTIYKRINGLQNKLLERFIGAAPIINYTYKIKSKDILLIEKGEFK